MSLRARVSTYLDDIETPAGLTTNLVILGLIVVSSVLFVVETFSLPEPAENWLRAIDLGVSLLFLGEYILRLWCADAKLKYIFSLFSFIDLMAILPGLFGLLDIRFVRILRWLRIVRVLRFMKLEASVLQLNRADSIILTRILLTLFSIVFVYSGLIYQVEHEVNSAEFRNFLDALYFCVVTMTTVGFGDVTPLSESGRILTILMISTGVLVIPWQASELIKQLVKAANKTDRTCPGCGLSAHDTDAKFCKLCGYQLPEALESKFTDQ